MTRARLRFALALPALLALVACTADAALEGDTATPALDGAAADAGADVASDGGTGLAFDRYHTQDEIHAYLAGVAAAHPAWATFEKLGASRQGREIAVLALSNAPLGSVPALYFNGTHHGDEWSSTEGILGFADWLVTHHDDAEAAAILDHYAVYLQPLVNPDGHAARTRADATGVDPNRDYAYPERAETASFNVPEIALVRALVDRIKPRAAAAYHSGIEEVLWPWCYTGTATSDDAKLASTSKAIADAMGFDRYLPSFDDYPTTGEFIDYAYWKHGTAALTFEVSTAKTPAASALAGVVTTSVKGARAFLAAVRAEDTGAALGTTSFARPGKRGSLGAAGPRTTPRLE